MLPNSLLAIPCAEGEDKYDNIYAKVPCAAPRRACHRAVLASRSRPLRAHGAASFRSRAQHTHANRTPCLPSPIQKAVPGGGARTNATQERRRLVVVVVVCVGGGGCGRVGFAQAHTALRPPFPLTARQHYCELTANVMYAHAVWVCVG